MKKSVLVLRGGWGAREQRGEMYERLNRLFVPKAMHLFCHPDTARGRVVIPVVILLETLPRIGAGLLEGELESGRSADE